MHPQRTGGDTARKGDGQKRDVIEIASPGPGKVGTTDTGNRGIRIKISCNTIPASGTIIGTQLHHTKRSLDSGIGIAFEISADERITSRG